VASANNFVSMAAGDDGFTPEVIVLLFGGDGGVIDVDGVDGDDVTTTVDSFTSDDVGGGVSILASETCPFHFRK